MRILVNGGDLAQSPYAQKRILIDTMILCYAHDLSSPSHDKASLIVKASVNGLIKTYVSYQNLAEFYSVITGERVKNPLTPGEASELCMLYERSVAIGKLLPNTVAYREAFASAMGLSIVNGEIFDCLLAYTAKGNIDMIWTENTRDFKEYDFLSAVNPLIWEWEEE